jgi:FtsH-binding integral membrane protein
MLIISIFSWVIQERYLDIFYSVLGSVLYGLFLILDTKLMIGENAIKYKTEDYILACVGLYYDIILIYLYVISAA